MFLEFLELYLLSHAGGFQAFVLSARTSSLLGVFLFLEATITRHSDLHKPALQKLHKTTDKLPVDDIFMSCLIESVSEQARIQYIVYL